VTVRRRRKKRHRLNPLAYLTPELFAQVTKVVALCAAAAAPSVMVSQQSAQKVEASEEQVGYANANTNAALGIIAVMASKIDSLEGRVSKLEREAARTRRILPEGMVGPEVPPGWTFQPVVKRKKWLGLF